MDLDRIRGAISKLKLAEKTSLSGGEARFDADCVGIKGVNLSHELERYWTDEPSTLAIGCTFSTEIAAAIGKSRSVEAAKAHNVFAGVIGSGLILDPMRYDAAEFFSEDQTVVAQMLGSYASAGVIGYVFTDALGQGRFVNRTIDARALYELYLYPLSRAGKYASALQLDGGYLNGKRVASSRHVSDIYHAYIKNSAMVMTQYGDGDGLDVVSGSGAYMLGTTSTQRKQVIKAVENGALFENKLNRSVERTLLTIVSSHEFYKNYTEEQAPMPNIVYDSAVLLKNDGTFPTKSQLTIFGDASKFDDGDKHVVLPIKDAMRKFGDINLFLITDYLAGIDEDDVLTILNTAGEAKTVVVLCGGVAAPLGYLSNHANAILFMPYCPTIDCVLEILSGVSPRGHLPFTWCKEREDYPRNNEKFIDRGDFRYESVFNGHTLFDNFAPDAVAYPFGHGLEYTSYEISSFKASCDKLVIRLSFDVKNIGECDGVPLLQAYVTYLGDSAFGLRKRLGCFKRLALAKGESSAVVMEINLNDLAVYDEVNNAFVPIGGKYLVELGLSSRDIVASDQVKISVGSKDGVGPGKKILPSYFAVGKPFEPTAPEIEKLLKVPYIVKLGDIIDLQKPTYKKIKKLMKVADKKSPPRLKMRIKYKIENTPIKD